MKATANSPAGDMNEGTPCATVVCSARLHLGFLDLNGGLGRRFGSFGLAVDQPVTRLTVRHARTTRIAGTEQERVARYLAILRRDLELHGGHAVDVATAVPPHAGLGSGTQLALALATALRRLHGLPRDLRGDAERLGRGGRSGIGIGLFERGGFVVDGGKGVGSSAPPQLARLAFPASWRVLLVCDPGGEGLSGSRERAAFAALPPMRAAACGEICRLLLMGVLPALVERDLGAFGSALARIQVLAGAHFAPAQGGRFTSAAVARALDALARAGAGGIGQSSWGPTGFAFAPDAAEARRMMAALQASGIAAGLDLLVCRGSNRGASISPA